ncbi:MAG: VCBS repeat-containing protein [Bacteroidota bacterium]
MKSIFLLFSLVSPILLFAQFGDEHVLDAAWDGNVEELVVDDIDGKNGDDVVVLTSTIPNRLFVYKNLGGNEFQVELVKEDINTLHSLKVLDINGDGAKDIVVTQLDRVSNRGHKLGWFQNNGEGNFGAFQKLMVFTQLHRIAPTQFLDADQDGDIDIWQSPIWYLNDGNGNLTESVPRGSDVDGIDLNGSMQVFIDLDEDGDLDMISLEDSSSKGYDRIIDDRRFYLSWYEHQDGIYKQVSKKLVDRLPTVRTILTEEVNGDSRPDLFLVSDNKVFLYENKGKGKFRSTKLPDDLSYGKCKTCTYKLYDADQDGDIDILSISYEYEHQVSGMGIYENEGKGTFLPYQSLADLPLTVEWIPKDINGDVQVDFITSREKIYLYLSESNSQYSTVDNISQDIGIQSVESLGMKDIDLDGLKDIVVAGMRTLGWYRNTGKGEFASFKEITSDVSLGKSIKVVNLNEDDTADILSIYYEKNKLAWYQNQGNGVFEEPIVIDDFSSKKEK